MRRFIIVIIISMLAFALNALTRIFICDSFVVMGPSMEPSFHNGEKVLAFKPGIGARIYTKYDFNDPRLRCFRLPGFRKLRKGDVAVFNHPSGTNSDSIDFKINYVLIKRCAGVPGDSVRIEGVEPFYVPCRGDRLAVDSTFWSRYRRQVRFETGGQESANLEEYTFKTNWYFFLGDNIEVSIDSRSFGLVPESYIVGRVHRNNGK